VAALMAAECFCSVAPYPLATLEESPWSSWMPRINFILPGGVDRIESAVNAPENCYQSSDKAFTLLNFIPALPV
jgi:hypothetical protein